MRDEDRNRLSSPLPSSLCPTPSSRIPPSALAFSYFLYFVAIGLFVPYFPAYLRERGLTTIGIGWLLAAGPLMRIVFPPLVGLAADKRHGSLFWSRTLAWGAFGGLSAAAFGGSRAWLIAGTLVYFVFVSSVIPLLDAATFAATAGSGQTRFGRVRLWGSVGFLVTSGALGVLYPRLPGVVIATSLVLAHLAFALFLSLLRAGSSARAGEAQNAGDDGFASETVVRQTGVLATPPETVSGGRDWAEARRLWRNPVLWLLLATLFLNRIASAPFNGFYTIFVRELGLGGDVVAWSWASGVGTEILLMLFIDRLVERYGFAHILTCGVLLEAARWFALAASTSTDSLLLIAPFHGVAFTMLYVASVHGLARIVPVRLRVFGQAAGAAATGLGQTLGFVLAGYLHDLLGNAGMFFAAGCAGVVASLCAVLLSRLKMKNAV